MDLKGGNAYDSQVADLSGNRKHISFSPQEITQILEGINCHASKGQDGQHNEWIMTIALHNSFPEDDEVAQIKPCQVVDFMAKKAELNRKCKGNLILEQPEKREAEMRKHFFEIDQKLRHCIQQKQKKSFWQKTADTISRVFKKI